MTKPFRQQGNKKVIKLPGPPKKQDLLGLAYLMGFYHASRREPRRTVEPDLQKAYDLGFDAKNTNKFTE